MWWRWEHTASLPPSLPRALPPCALTTTTKTYPPRPHPGPKHRTLWLIGMLALGCVAPPALFPLAANGGIKGSFAYAVLMGTVLVRACLRACVASPPSESLKRERLNQERRKEIKRTPPPPLFPYLHPP